MTKNVRKALKCAVKAHDGQYDKAGEPYILHPLEVSFMLEGEDEQIAALLHDVVEDTDYMLDDIRSWGFGHLVEAIDCLTRRKDETYKEFIMRISENRLATTVKIADMKHNLSRIDQLPENERGLADRYNKWLPVLEKKAAETAKTKSYKRMERPFLVSYDGEISQDVGYILDVRATRREVMDYEAYQEYLDRNNDYVDYLNDCGHYYAKWRNEQISKPFPSSFKPYIDHLTDLDEKDIYIFVKKTNALFCLVEMGIMKRTPGAPFEPHIMIGNVEEAIKGSILDFSLAEIAEAIIMNNGCVTG